MNMFSSQASKEKLSELFHDFMEMCGTLPVNPWSNKKTLHWIESQGCRMAPYRNDYFYITPSGFVPVWVKCKPRRSRRSRRYHHDMLIEIPEDFAEKMLVLGFVP
jgi:hypothetical protein